jgi:uncharacterized protein (DUF2147 family)
MRGMKYLLATVIGSVATVGVALAGDPSGDWIMANGKVTVHISKCPSGICAHIVALKEPLDKSGKPKIDKLNPDPALRKRPLMGLILASDLAPSGADKWTGSIYNPDDGRTYSASVLVSGSTMQVKGCIVGILCKSNNFLRME